MRCVGCRGGGGDKQVDGATNIGWWGGGVVGQLGVGNIVSKQFIFCSEWSSDCKERNKNTKYNQFTWIFLHQKMISFQTSVIYNQLKLLLVIFFDNDQLESIWNSLHGLNFPR